MLSSEVGKLEEENRKLRLAIQRLQTKFQEENEMEKPKACEYCKFYLRHYIKSGSRYAKTGCGHCVHGRMKNRKPKDTCQYFEMGDWEAERLCKETMGEKGGQG